MDAGGSASGSVSAQFGYGVTLTSVSLTKDLNGAEEPRNAPPSLELGQRGGTHSPLSDHTLSGRILPRVGGLLSEPDCRDA